MSKDTDSRLHVWDRPALLRALLWAVVTEGVIVRLSALRHDASSGPPHNFPKNLSVLFFIPYHLPSIIVAALLWLGSTFVVVLQTALVAYLLFVPFRLKKIKARLY